MAGKGDKLTDDARTFVVQQLAMFDPPETVAKAVKAEFSMEITRQAVEAYNPTKRAGAKLSERWRTLFEETRRTFLENTADIGVSHRAVRLRALQRLAERAEVMGNIGLAAQLLEQAAKETGDAFTNRQKVEHTGKDGGPLQVDETHAAARIAALMALASARRRADESE